MVPLKSVSWSHEKSVVRLRWLLGIAVVAVGCNALTGVGDLAVTGAGDAGVPETSVPDVIAVDPGNDGQASPGDAGADAEDATLDGGDADVATTTPPTPRSCADALKQGTAQSGNVLIDPDGNGGDPPYDAFCDMNAAGGGWTEIFRWTTELSAGNVGYTNGSPALMSAVSSVLIAHRDSTGMIVSNYATFPIPNAWRTLAPFDDQQSNATVAVSVNGAAATNQNLRFGNDDFDTTCDGVWQPDDGDSYGRICIQGTTAPFFNGFNSGDDDHCSLSDQAYNAEACSDSQAFSISVR